MRIWGKIIKDHKIMKDVVQEFALARPSDIYGWTPIISTLCTMLDIERPVILEKHTLVEMSKGIRKMYTPEYRALRKHVFQ